MPQKSVIVMNKLSNYLQNLSAFLKKHHTPTDLSLMVLGNMVTNLINTSIAPAQRMLIADSFLFTLYVLQ